MCAHRAREWPVPPPEGFVAEDLDRIQDLPAHTELIDGSLVFVSPQKGFHTLLLFLLELNLRRSAPERFAVRREMTVFLGERQRPEPDMMVIHADAVAGPEQTWFPAESVELAIEVVSPDSRERDWERKPELYARAGIHHFWLVEDNQGEPVVYVYELDPLKQEYTITGIHHDRLEVSAPFTIDIDLTEVKRL